MYIISSFNKDIVNITYRSLSSTQEMITISYYPKDNILDC